MKSLRADSSIGGAWRRRAVATQVIYFATALAGTALCVYGQDRSQLQQSLSAQFALTEVTKDRSDIVTAGVSLVLQKDGLLMYSTACPSSPATSYKNGKLSQSLGHNFMRDLGGSMQMSGTSTTANCPQRRFVRGTKLWATKVGVQKDGIVFQLYSDPDNGLRYYGDLKFSFDKGPAPTPDQALAMIAEVLTIQPVENSADNTQGQSMEQVAGLYLMANATANQLRLNTDGTFSLVQSGRNYAGTFTLDGNKLMAQIGNQALKQAGVLQNDTIVEPDGKTWVKQQAAVPPPTPPPSYTAIPPPPPPPDQPSAPPAVVEIGQTPDQVKAALGQPASILKASATKLIYVYKDLKVTFVNGKVTDIQ